MDQQFGSKKMQIEMKFIFIYFLNQWVFLINQCSLPVVFVVVAVNFSSSYLEPLRLF